jgi:hypothetical protein
MSITFGSVSMMKCKGKVPLCLLKHNARKSEILETEHHAFLASTPHKNEKSDSRSGHFISGERALFCTYITIHNTFEIGKKIVFIIVVAKFSQCFN